MHSKRRQVGIDALEKNIERLQAEVEQLTRSSAILKTSQCQQMAPS